MHLHVIFFFPPHINGLKLTSVSHFLFEFLSLVDKNFRIFRNVLNFSSVANLTIFFKFRKSPKISKSQNEKQGKMQLDEKMKEFFNL
jgi:hypothetical protein